MSKVGIPASKIGKSHVLGLYWYPWRCAMVVKLSKRLGSGAFPSFRVLFPQISQAFEKRENVDMEDSADSGASRYCPYCRLWRIKK